MTPLIVLNCIILYCIDSRERSTVGVAITNLMFMLMLGAFLGVERVLRNFRERLGSQEERLCTIPEGSFGEQGGG